MVLWRYFASAYLSTFFLSVTTFVSVILISRLREIARFAALTSNFGKTALFAVYQIPFILPMAIPLSSLLASFLLFQRLSRSHELTALRASGLSLKKILTPVITSSLFLALASFSISAELAPYCKRQSKLIFYEETSPNPLVLLQRQQLVRAKNAYLHFDAQKELSVARDFTLILYNESNRRLNLISAEKLSFLNSELVGQEVAIVSHLNGEKFDSLIIENQTSMSTTTPLISKSIKKKRPALDSSDLSFRMLEVKLSETIKKAQGALIEILRRCSLSLSVFTLTWLGCIFAIEQRRNSSCWALIYALFLTFLLLTSYFLSKSFKYKPLLVGIAFFIPHLLIWLSCFWRIRRISRGQL